MLIQVKDQRWLLAYPAPTAFGLCRAKVPGTTLQDPGEALLNRVTHLGLVDVRNRPGGINVLVPGYDRRQPSQHCYVLAVGSCNGPREAACSLFGILGDAAGHDEAGGQPLEIPLEGSRQRLVEVVDVEYRFLRGSAAQPCR
jgi:hypothetical protein